MIKSTQMVKKVMEDAILRHRTQKPSHKNPADDLMMDRRTGYKKRKWVKILKCTCWNVQDSKDKQETLPDTHTQTHETYATVLLFCTIICIHPSNLSMSPPATPSFYQNTCLISHWQISTFPAWHTDREKEVRCFYRNPAPIKPISAMKKH